MPEPTLRRLPWYLSNIKLMKEKGEQYVSSTQISKEINIDASQIAKDLSYVNISGRTRVGYNIDALIEVLESFLGFTNMHKAFLFGVGSLGAALLRDSGLHHFGLEIVAAFDVNPELVGKDLNGIPIFHSDDFEVKGMEQDKINAYMTLYTTLVTLAKISAPMVPFMTESIYRNLVCSIDKNAPISIHLCDFPKVNEQFIDKKLEETMDDVLDAVVIGRACRNSTNIKNRQPIGKMFIKADWKLDEFYTAIIADELNVKEVEYTDDVRAFTSYSFKPQMKTLGPKYGKLLNAIRTALTEVDGNATMDKLNESGSFELNVEGQTIELSKDDVLIEMTQKEGFVASSDKGITVVLDTNLTPELIEEGFVREVISKVQTMRKDAGFEVMDKINLYVSGNDKIADIVNRNAAQVKTVVLAQDIITGKTAGFEKEWDINGEKVTLAVEKLA